MRMKKDQDAYLTALSPQTLASAGFRELPRQGEETRQRISAAIEAYAQAQKLRIRVGHESCI